MAGAAGGIDSAGTGDAGHVMLDYHLELALRNLRRNLVLTTLMIVAVGVGIGASMTMLTTLVAMSSDPIPDKSSQLFVPQMDSFGEGSKEHNSNWIPRQLPYRDAVALMKMQPDARQASMYPIGLNVKPARGAPFPAAGRATGADFFSMFEVPFRSGAPWGRRADDDRDNAVVLSSRLADRVFPGVEAVGKTINLGKRDYRVTGVIGSWNPLPRFYDEQAYAWSSDGEDFFIPFSIAIERQIQTLDYGCDATSLPPDWTGRLNSDCAWVQLWLELPQAGQVRTFTTNLQNYAAEQQRLGRFQWLPLVTLRDVPQWLAHVGAIPSEVRINSIIASGFLIVCLINAVGLMLAKFSSRAVELSVRRALGASRVDLFMQCLTETFLIGLSGGLLGLALTAAGLSAVRALRGIEPADTARVHLASLDMQMVAITFAVAIITTVCSGLYPAWRASRVQPGWQLKAQ
ncbi:MAG TPA: ABC transporter permease [Steroidobacteraceae bacterium]|nr:ABC transporter permease [Steroidobacteraceae bacterium]